MTNNGLDEARAMSCYTLVGEIIEDSELGAICKSSPRGVTELRRMTRERERKAFGVMDESLHKYWLMGFEELLYTTSRDKRKVSRMQLLMELITQYEQTLGRVFEC